MDVNLISSLDPKMEGHHIYKDSLITKGDSPLNNLLDLQTKYIPSTEYLKECCNMNAVMHQMVVDWMKEVCIEQSCEDDVFPKSVEYMGRCLSLSSARESPLQLQLLGATCLYIAFRCCEYQMSADDIVEYTDNSIDIDRLMDMELRLLSLLKWDMVHVKTENIWHSGFCELFQRFNSFNCELSLTNQYGRDSYLDRRWLRYPLDPVGNANCRPTNTGDTGNGHSSRLQGATSMPTSRAGHTGASVDESGEERGGTPEVIFCFLCHINVADAVVLPCGHQVCCHTCARIVNECPQCKTTISHSSVRTYDPNMPSQPGSSATTVMHN